MGGNHQMSWRVITAVLSCLVMSTDGWLNIRRCSGSSLPQPDATYTFKDITKSSYRVGEKVVYDCAPGLEKEQHSGSRVAECTAYNGWELKDDDLHCAARTTTQKTTTTKKPTILPTTSTPTSQREVPKTSRHAFHLGGLNTTSRSIITEGLGRAAPGGGNSPSTAPPTTLTMSKETTPDIRNSPNRAGAATSAGTTWSCPSIPLLMAATLSTAYTAFL